MFYHFSIIFYSLYLQQKELFLGKLDPGSPRSGERKMSSSSSSSMKTKWLKAFRSLKPATSATATNERYVFRFKSESDDSNSRCCGYQLKLIYL